MELIVTDLDGTLLNDANIVSERDMNSLMVLGEKGVCRVIATGRSMYSINKVLEDDFPVDYIIFSSGSGVVEWRSKTLIHQNMLMQQEVIDITRLLMSLDLDFMVHHPIPDNHKFYYHYKNANNKGFVNRMQIYLHHAEPLEDLNKIMGACQILVVLPNDVELYHYVKSKIDGVTIIRATSPIHDGYIWLEIFPSYVSKGKALNWLCAHVDIDLMNTLSVGNDYNDIEMLDSTQYRYVVRNAPSSLKMCYPVVCSNNESGFSDAIARYNKTKLI